MESRICMPRLKVDWSSFRVTYCPITTNLMPKLIAFINILMVRKVKCILHSLYWCLPVGFLNNHVTFLSVEIKKSQVNDDQDVYIILNVTHVHNNSSAPVMECQLLYSTLP